MCIHPPLETVPPKLLYLLLFQWRVTKPQLPYICGTFSLSSVGIDWPDIYPFTSLLDAKQIMPKQ